jgi:hypothetical protein
MCPPKGLTVRRGDGGQFASATLRKSQVVTLLDLPKTSLGPEAGGGDRDKALPWRQGGTGESSRG